ncbi:MAG: hypothetical protein AB7S26_29140 [Sandaracinaceae bacterium]
MSDELDRLLDEATIALRLEDAPTDEEPAEDDARLDAILSALASPRVLDEAVAALRAEDADAPADDDATLASILAATKPERAPSREPARAPWTTRWAVAASIALALAITGSSAWAFWDAYGREWTLDDEAEPMERPSAPAPLPWPTHPVAAPLEESFETSTSHATHSEGAQEPDAIDPPVDPVSSRGAALATRDADPVRADATRIDDHRPPRDRATVADADPVDDPVASAPPSERATPSIDPIAEEPPPDDEETRRFASAHDAHFRAHDPSAALGAWDDYLRAYPHGRYELEARYNRGVTLVRLGRYDAARAALTPFADGAHGGYRRSEARAMIDALDARIAADR